MADSAAHKRALEILADPRSTEKEWMTAVTALGGKLPATSRRKNFRKKLLRFGKRASGLSLLYVVLISTYGLVAFGTPLSLSILPIALVWGILEASFGAFTLLALWVLFNNLGSILSFSPYFQLTWMVILLNVMVYSKFNWRPYVMVPVRKLVDSQAKKTKLIG